MVAERWLTFILIFTVGTMAFTGIGLSEEQRATMEGTVRAMIEESRRSDQDTIARMGQGGQVGRLVLQVQGIHDERGRQLRQPLGRSRDLIK